MTASLVVLDTQSVHAAASVPAATTGKDPGKKVPGRKRCLATDVLGLVIARGPGRLNPWSTSAVRTVPANDGLGSW
jgi:hypothetical protein